MSAVPPVKVRSQQAPLRHPEFQRMTDVGGRAPPYNIKPYKDWLTSLPFRRFLVLSCCCCCFLITSFRATRLLFLGTCNTHVYAPHIGASQQPFLFTPGRVGWGGASGAGQFRGLPEAILGSVASSLGGSHRVEKRRHSNGRVCCVQLPMESERRAWHTYPGSGRYRLSRDA